MRIRPILLAVTTGICLTGCVRWGGARLPTAQPREAQLLEPADEAVLQALDDALAELVAGLEALEPVDAPIP